MIKIIDYGMGNCGSIKNMLRFLGVDSEIVTQPKQLVGANALILPGVGSFDHGMNRIAPFREVLEQQVRVNKTPFLGICLGMQLLLENSEEGSVSGLGWIKGRVKRFDFSTIEQKQKLVVPHMGWNKVMPQNDSKLLSGTEDVESRFYFVHSFHADGVPVQNVIAESHYGYGFVCAVQQNNIMGVQFHPEKSHKFGKQLFTRFIELSQC